MSTSDKNTKVTVDSKRFIYVDGIRIGRVVGNGRLQFCDKDRRRSSERGTRYVEVQVTELAAATTPDKPVDK